MSRQAPSPERAASVAGPTSSSGAVGAANEHMSASLRDAGQRFSPCCIRAGWKREVLSPNKHRDWGNVGNSLDPQTGRHCCHGFFDAQLQGYSTSRCTILRARDRLEKNTRADITQRRSATRRAASKCRMMFLASTGTHGPCAPIRQRSLKQPSPRVPCGQAPRPAPTSTATPAVSTG